MLSPSKHILVIRFSAMGDVAMTIPVLRILLETYPDISITVVSRSFFKPLFHSLPRTNFLEADVYVKHKGVKGLIRLAKEAKLLKIDAVADLHQVLRSKVMNLYFKAHRVPVAKIDKGRREKKALIKAEGKKIMPLKTTHQRYADVFSKLGFPIDLTSPIFPEKPLLNNTINEYFTSEKKYIGIAPFAAHISKQYPIKQIRKLLEILSDRSDYQVYLFGGGTKEIEELHTLENEFYNTVSFAGKLDFETELKVIQQLDVMVSMDSGNGHLAAIYGVPVITLWGNTHPYAGFVPFNQPPNNQLLADRKRYPKIPTSIYGNKLPEGYENVMNSIPAELVFDTIKSIIE